MMGRGIVHPVDAMHTEPWNEDLLEHLANQLVKENYDLKKVIAHIAASEAYQAHTEVRSSDEGTYAYAGPVARRMTVEQFLDSIRQISSTWPARS